MCSSLEDNVVVRNYKHYCSPLLQLMRKTKAKFIYVMYKDSCVSRGKCNTFILPMLLGAYSCNKCLGEVIEIAKNGDIAKRRNCDRNYNEYLEMHAQFKYSLQLYP